MKLSFSEKQRKGFHTILFFFVLFSYLITCIVHFKLFKYISFSDLLSHKPFATDHSYGINLVPFSDWTLDTERAINNMINNITLFFPFGFLLQMSSKKKVLCGYAIWIPLLISLLTETIQYLLSLGVGDITDVIMNTIGATVGAIAYLLFCIFFQNRVEKASEILLYLFGVFTIIVIILWM